MNKLTQTIILSLFCTTLYSQSTDSLAIKITSKMCNCFGFLKDSESYQMKFDSCYDIAVSDVIADNNWSEIHLLLNRDAREKVNDRIEQLIYTDCAAMIGMIATELNQAIEESDSSNVQSFPINFSNKDIKKYKKWEGKIVALEGIIERLEISPRNTPYYKLKVADKSIWIFSMINSGFEKIGKRVRVVGYFLKKDKTDSQSENQFHTDGYHILAFGIVNVSTKQLAYFPGSEGQMKQWINGQIPSSGK
jgi:hypothetical protein